MSKEHPMFVAGIGGDIPLVFLLHLPPGDAEGGIVGQGFQAAQL
jgi:hypothetical protein